MSCSLVRVLGNEELVTYVPVISSAACPCADGEEVCVQACPHDALLFVDDCDIPTHLRSVDGTMACPVVDMSAASWQERRGKTERGNTVDQFAREGTRR